MFTERPEPAITSVARQPQGSGRVGGAIPDRAGVGFKGEHAGEVLDGPERVAWFEVHPENYMVAGGPRLAVLRALRDRFPVSLHGVGLSLGGPEPLDDGHLRAWRRLIDLIDPGLVSEHIAWSAHDGTYYADLLPVPLTRTAQYVLVDNINRMQDAIGRRILIENPTSYLALPENELPELDFIVGASERSGCGLLIDVNNIFISARNLGFVPDAYVDAIPDALVGEIHLAGHGVETRDGDTLLIDNHASPVVDDVWALYERLIGRIGPRPTLIEWDNDIPGWDTLAGEAEQADRRMRGLVRRNAA